MDRCPNCGASVRPGARFCTACGHRLTPTTTAASSSESESQTDAVATDYVSSITLTAAADGATSSPSSSTVSKPTDSTAEEAQASSTVVATVGGVDTRSAADATNATTDASATEDDLDLDLPRGGAPAGETNERATPEDEGEPVADDADLDLLPPADERKQTNDTEPLDAENLDASAVDDTQRSSDVGAAGPHHADTQHEDEAGDQNEQSDATYLQNASAADRSSDTGGQRTISWSEQEPDPQDSTSPDGSAKGQDNSTGTIDRDDVVLDTTVVGAPTWASGSTWQRDANASSSATGEAGESPSGGEHSSRVSWHPEPSATANNEATDPATQATATGPDVDWEPWGGDSSASDNGADTGPSAQNEVTESVNMNAGGANGAGHAESAINRAGDLLDQLRAALTTIGDEQRAAKAGASDRAAGPAWVALVNDIDDARSHALPDDTLDFLADRAHELAGNEWDVRVLQRFAEQRQVVLDLIHRYREQHALLDRITEANSDA